MDVFGLDAFDEASFQPAADQAPALAAAAAVEEAVDQKQPAVKTKRGRKLAAAADEAAAKQEQAPPQSEGQGSAPQRASRLIGKTKSQITTN